MAEVQSNDQGGGGKNKQKKQTLRVDFTPMVDMNMLLITFFMLCTTLLKPQTMNINMPSKDDVEEGQENKVRQSTAITLLLGSNNEIYYYQGMPEDASYEDPNFLTETNYGASGLRQFLIENNVGPYREIQDLKEKKAHLEITEEEYREKVKEIQKTAQENKIAPTVMIKPSELATYKNMVDALDEMSICNIGFYAILDISDGDRHLLYKKTGNTDYLTPEKLAELEANTGTTTRR